SVVAPQGDISITAPVVEIGAVMDTAESRQTFEAKQSGLTLSVSNPVVSAVQTAQQMNQAAGQTSDSRMKALAAATTALAAKNAYDVVQAGQGSTIDGKEGQIATTDAQGNPSSRDANIADKIGGINVSISLGSSRSQSESSQSSSMAVGSNVAAGNNLTVQATAGDLTVIGSTLSAGNNASLAATGNLNLLAAANASSSQSSSSGRGSSVGLGYSTVGGLYASASANKSSGNSNGQDTVWTGTQVSAGNVASLDSGGDTTLRGAVVSGKQVVEEVGGNLGIESLQDSSTYRESANSAGFGVSVPIAGGTGFSASLNASQTKINSDYQSANTQSGIKAGDEGFQVSVANNTDLKGAVIASTDKAVLDGRNLLVTGTLTTSDIQNRASYQGSSVNLGVGYSTSGNSVGKDSQGNATTGAGQTPGSSLPSLNGFSATLPIAMNASGEASGISRSAVSGATVLIANDAGQQALTGKSATETVASLNRDTANANGAITPIFNKQEIKAGFEIVGAFTQQVGTFLVNRAAEVDGKTQEAKNKDQQADANLSKAQTLPDSPEKTQLQQESAQLRQEAIQARVDAKDLEDKWGAGGTYRQVLGAISAAASGNVTASGSQFVQSTVVNLIQAKAAQEIKQLADDLGIAEGSPTHAALHAINACAGAAVQGGNCGAAALGAASAAVAGALLIDAESLTNTQKEARKNLIATLVAGVTASNDAAAAATNAALIELENNSNVKNAVKVAINDAKVYLGTKAREGGEKLGQLLEKLEIQTFVEKKESIKQYIDAAATRGGLTEPELAVLATLAAANEVLFPVSALDLVGASKIIRKASDLIKAGVRAEDATKVAVAEAKTAELSSKTGTTTKAEMLAENSARGRAFQCDALCARGVSENTQRITVTIEGGKTVTVIPDALGKTILEVKDVKNLSNSDQFRGYLETSVQQNKAIELIVSPRTESISGPLVKLIEDSGGTIKVFDPATKTFRAYMGR
ncbi:MAG: hemagglutinin repeat-containing protein, partial [Sulfuricella sp.]